MRWLAVLVLQASCVAPVAIGAAVTTGYAGGMAAMNRSAGGCIATCTGGLVCNAHTGLCESPREVCDTSSDHPVCVQQAPQKSDVAAQAPGRGPVRVMPPPPPLTGDATRIITGAEANPPSSK